jgi:putative mRNA 3-end processing factor
VQLCEILSISPAGLYCARGDFHIDPKRPVPRAVVTHGHSDHARAGCGEYICTPGTAELIRCRLGSGIRVREHAYRKPFELGESLLSFHSAGHVLGSAQVRIEVEGFRAVVTGDYKRDSDPSCEAFELVECDLFVTESTFALPIYRWPSSAEVANEIVEWWQAKARAGVTSILMGYSLGKAQRLLAELKKLHAGPVFVHDTIEDLNKVYRAQGIELISTRRLSSLGENEKLGTALVLVPPGAKLDSLASHMDRFETAFASGWMRVKNAMGRRSYDRAFVLSDHADWPTLVKTAFETRARTVLVTHGKPELLSRYLREQGLEAHDLEPYLVHHAHREL